MSAHLEPRQGLNRKIGKVGKRSHRRSFDILIQATGHCCVTPAAVLPVFPSSCSKKPDSLPVHPKKRLSNNGTFSKCRIEGSPEPSVTSTISKRKERGLRRSRAR